MLIGIARQTQCLRRLPLTNYEVVCEATGFWPARQRLLRLSCNLREALIRLTSSNASVPSPILGEKYSEPQGCSRACSYQGPVTEANPTGGASTGLRLKHQQRWLDTM